MEKRRLDPVKESHGVARRRAYREEILAVLEGLCKKLEKLQQSEDGRVACREVARLIGDAKARDAGRETV